MPAQIIFVTNVRLSSFPVTGGIDSVAAFIELRRHAAIGSDKRDTLAARGLLAVKVWHRDQLNALVTKYDGVRNAFKGLLTVGDLMTRLGSLGGLLEPDAFQPVLAAHASISLGSERWVNFRDAGGSTRESIENVVIDLAIKGEDEHAPTILAEVITRAEQVMRPSFGVIPRHVLLTGLPGSGKSTVTQFLNQLYRVGFSGEETHYRPLTIPDVPNLESLLQRLESQQLVSSFTRSNEDSWRVNMRRPE